MVGEFTYLGSTISNKLSFDKEIDKHIGRAVLTLARLRTHVWKNLQLTIKIKVLVYNIWVLSTFYTEANPGQHMLLKSVTCLLYLSMSSIFAHSGS